MFNNNTLHIVLSSRTSVSVSSKGYYIEPRHMPPKCLSRYVVVYTYTRTGCPPEGLSLVITNLISYSLTLLCDVLPCAVYMQRHIPLVYFLIKQSKICSLCNVVYKRVPFVYKSQILNWIPFPLRSFRCLFNNLHWLYNACLLDRVSL